MKRKFFSWINCKQIYGNILKKTSDRKGEKLSFPWLWVCVWPSETQFSNNMRIFCTISFTSWMEWVECILFLLAVWIFSTFSTKLLNLQERRTSCGQVSVEKTSILLGLKEFFAMLKIINFHYNFLMKFVRLHFFYYFNCTTPTMIIFFSSLSSFWDQFKQVISTIQVFWSF